MDDPYSIICVTSITINAKKSEEVTTSFSFFFTDSFNAAFTSFNSHFYNGWYWKND